MENSTSPHAPSDGSEETFFWVLGILLFVLVVAVAPTFGTCRRFTGLRRQLPRKSRRNRKGRCSCKDAQLVRAQGCTTGSSVTKKCTANNTEPVRLGGEAHRGGVEEGHWQCQTCSWGAYRCRALGAKAVGRAWRVATYLDDEESSSSRRSSFHMAMASTPLPVLPARPLASRRCRV